MSGEELLVEGVAQLEEVKEDKTPFDKTKRAYGLLLVILAIIFSIGNFFYIQVGNIKENLVRVEKELHAYKLASATDRQAICDRLRSEARIEVSQAVELIRHRSDITESTHKASIKSLQEYIRDNNAQAAQLGASARLAILEAIVYKNMSYVGNKEEEK